jgi:hypothetical protein
MGSLEVSEKLVMGRERWVSDKPHQSSLVAIFPPPFAKFAI